MKASSEQQHLSLFNLLCEGYDDGKLIYKQQCYIKYFRKYFNYKFQITFLKYFNYFGQVAKNTK